jgi:hypothetical protein
MDDDNDSRKEIVFKVQIIYLQRHWEMNDIEVQIVQLKLPQ